MWRILVLLFHSAIISSGQDDVKQWVSPQTDPGYARARIEIVVFHNYFRTTVSPKASDMLKMSWHAEAASQAQTYAEQCQRKHNDPSERIVEPLGACGQNLYVSKDEITWYNVLKSWFDDGSLFVYGGANPVEMVSNYTKMVWASTHKIGCGVAYCRDGDRGHFYNYVCHYCPYGYDPEYGMDFPYREGEPCGECPNDCDEMRLCTNACEHTNYNSTCHVWVKYNCMFCKEWDFCNASCICGDRWLHKSYPWWLY